MLDEDQEVRRLEFSTECVGVLAAALATQADKFNAEGRDQQLIRPTGMQVARTDQGEPMVLMTIKDGIELPLVFKPESLGVLISELQGLMRMAQPGSEVRWR